MRPGAADPGRHGASRSQAAPRCKEPVDLSQGGPEGGAAEDAGRATVPGTGDEYRPRAPPMAAPARPTICAAPWPASAASAPSIPSASRWSRAWSPCGYEREFAEHCSSQHQRVSAEEDAERADERPRRRLRQRARPVDALRPVAPGDGKNWPRPTPSSRSACRVAMRCGRCAHSIRWVPPKGCRCSPSPARKACSGSRISACRQCRSANR